MDGEFSEHEEGSECERPVSEAKINSKIYDIKSLHLQCTGTRRANSV